MTLTEARLLLSEAKARIDEQELELSRRREEAEVLQKRHGDVERQLSELLADIARLREHAERMEAERERELVERELLRAQCLSLAQEKVEAEKSSCCAMPLSLFWICFESVPIFFVCFFFCLLTVVAAAASLSQSAQSLLSEAQTVKREAENKSQEIVSLSKSKEELEKALAEVRRALEAQKARAEALAEERDELRRRLEASDAERYQLKGQLEVLV
jgi:septal ring factor EnvC (AmiA/AmiB activator)